MNLKEMPILKNTINSGKKPIVIDRREKSVEPYPGLPTVITQYKDMTNSEISALRQSISETFISEQGWVANKNGGVVNDKGRSIYKAGYITAIKKVLHTIDIGHGKS